MAGSVRLTCVFMTLCIWVNICQSGPLQPDAVPSKIETESLSQDKIETESLSQDKIETESLSEEMQQPIVAAVEMIDEPILGSVDEPIIGSVDEPIIGSVDEPIIGSVDEPIIGSVDEVKMNEEKMGKELRDLIEGVRGLEAVSPPAEGDLHVDWTGLTFWRDWIGNNGGAVENQEQSADNKVITVDDLVVAAGNQDDDDDDTIYKNYQEDKEISSRDAEMIEEIVIEDVELMIAEEVITVNTETVTVRKVADNASWEEWKSFHGKMYSSSEEDGLRESVYLKRQELVQTHNSETDKHSYTLGLNEFADLEFDEFIGTMTGYKTSTEFRDNLYGVADMTCATLRVPLLSAFDWRDYEGVVTGVKYQGSCGSCWAFSAVGALEGMQAIYSGVEQELSEQNLIDCSWDQGNMGCQGGFMTWAFDYVVVNEGIDTEESYPYTKSDSSFCLYTEANRGAQPTDYYMVEMGNERALECGVSKVGPAAVALTVTDELILYDEGVFNEADCPDAYNQLNHAVVAVGYDTVEDGGDYWILKNSWGVNWGMDGYFQLARGVNQCGISVDASIPFI